jgi:hypothetical protein
MSRYETEHMDCVPCRKLDPVIRRGQSQIRERYSRIKNMEQDQLLGQGECAWHVFYFVKEGRSRCSEGIEMQARWGGDIVCSKWICHLALGIACLHAE